MAIKKYGFVENDFKKLTINEKIVHRIIALKDFSDVKKGDLGGYIESEKNLSQCDSSWVYSDAVVCDNARVIHNAVVCGYAMVMNNTVVGENACVMGNCLIRDNAVISGGSVVSGNAIICDNVICDESTTVNCNAVIKGTIALRGECKISGNIVLDISVTALYDANLDSKNQFIAFHGVGSRFDTTAVYRNIHGTLSVSCGCFHGSIEEFKEQVKETHGRRSIYAKEYMGLIKNLKNHDFGLEMRNSNE